MVPFHKVDMPLSLSLGILEMPYPLPTPIPTSPHTQMMIYLNCLTGICTITNVKSEQEGFPQQASGWDSGSMVKGTGSNPGQGTKILHATPYSQEKKKKCTKDTGDGAVSCLHNPGTLQPL